MQRASIRCFSNQIPSFPPTSHRLVAPFQSRPTRAESVASPLWLPLTCLYNYRHARPLLHSTVTEEIVKTAETESGFTKIGHISSVHGLQREICVKPSTDFPELRFSKPGKIWLRQQLSDRETVQEVEPVEGRGEDTPARRVGYSD